MAGIQVGGIVSGMDTNSIVDKLMQQAKVPVDRLYGEYEYKKLESEVFDDFNDKLGNVTSDLLTMRLESTFKTKLTDSTDSSIVTATATTDAAVGSHSITVNQLAKNSSASSSFSRYSLSIANFGLTSVSGLSHDYLEAVHEITIAEDGTDYMSTTESKISNVGMMSKTAGDALDGAYVDSYGEIQSDIVGSFTISYTDNNGGAQTLTITDTFASTSQDINDLAYNLETAFNDELNTAMGTSSVQYLSFRAEYDSGNWNLAMYETTVDDYNISVGGTDSTLRDELGFSEASTPTTSSTTTMYKYHRSDGLYTLQQKMLSETAGVVTGATYKGTGDIFKTGTFTIAQDASLKVASDTYTSYTGETVSLSGSLDLSATNLQNAGFFDLYSVNSEQTNGFFTINDVKITIDKYYELSVHDLLGVINSSGAGVTATYDSDTDKFTIKSNTPGSQDIKLGSYSDTSNILELMKLDNSSDRTFQQGSTSGSIDSSEHLTNAGLTVYPYTGTFTINGVSIYVNTSKESLNDVINKVNRSGAGVTMSYDNSSDKVTLRSDSIDAIKVGSANDTSNLLEALNLTDDTTVEHTIGSTGQRAILTVDGTTYVRDSNTVDDVIAGVALSLNGASDSSASISVSVDSSKAIEAFAKFVAHYNELMENLNVPDLKDDEKKYMEYLTDADKETMSEDDIASYLEKYKKYNTYDIIRKSSELRNMDNTLRKAFFSERTGISGSINDMSDLGIEVAGSGDLEKELYGYLVDFSTDYEEIIEKLKENSDFISMLEEDPDSVYTFFANSPEKVERGEPGYDQYVNELGWARYFNELISERYTSDEGMIGGKLGTGGTIFTELASLEKRIESREDRVENQLERYWAQFTAMEQAIADAQAQGAAFSNASSS